MFAIGMLSLQTCSHSCAAVFSIKQFSYRCHSLHRTSVQLLMAQVPGAARSHGEHAAHPPRARKPSKQNCAACGPRVPPHGSAPEVRARPKVNICWRYYAHRPPQLQRRHHRQGHRYCGRCWKAPPMKGGTDPLLCQCCTEDLCRVAGPELFQVLGPLSQAAANGPDDLIVTRGNDSMDRGA